MQAAAPAALHSSARPVRFWRAACVIHYFAIILITWIQTHTPKAMLGRMMALMMLSGTGLAPISQAISGAISKGNLTLAFAIPGVLVLLVTIWMAFNADLKGFSTSLTAAQAEE